MALPAGDDRPDGGRLVERDRERLLGEFRDVREELVGLDVGAVAAPLERDAPLAQARREPLGLVHHPLDLVLGAHLGETARENLHRPARHAAVRVETLVEDDLVDEVLVVGRVVRGEETTGVRLRILRAVEEDDVGRLGDLLDDVGDRPLCLPRLVLLHVPGVLDDPGDVEDETKPVPVRRGSDRAEVREAEGVLPVGERLEQNDRRLPLRDERLELRQVDVPGEDRLVPVANVGDLDRPRRPDVDPPDGVARDERTLRDDRRDEELDRTQAVVGRADPGVPEDAVHRLGESPEVACPGVGLVADELAGDLVLAHRARPVRQHVERHLRRHQVEGVEVRPGEVPLPFLEGREGDQPDSFDLVGFVERCGGRHVSSSCQQGIVAVGTVRGNSIWNYSLENAYHPTGVLSESASDQKAPR